MKRSILAILLFLVPLAASAKSTREITYRFNQVWNTTVRFLRVDNGYPITEQDRKSGYLMFDYTDGGTMKTGSVELVETSRENRRYLTVGIRVESMPSYIEVLLLDKLERKLRDEYGDPPPAAQEMSSRRRDNDDAGKKGDEAEEDETATSDDADKSESARDDK